MGGKAPPYGESSFLPFYETIRHDQNIFPGTNVKFRGPGSYYIIKAVSRFVDILFIGKHLLKCLSTPR